MLLGSGLAEAAASRLAARFMPVPEAAAEVQRMADELAAADSAGALAVGDDQLVPGTAQLAA